MNLLVNCHDDLWKYSRKQLKYFLVTKDQTHLHRFRIGVKQLNVFSRLLTFADNDFGAPHFLKRLDRIFTHAGELRDDYVIGNFAKIYAVDNFIKPGNEELQQDHFDKLKDAYRKSSAYIFNARLKSNKSLEKMDQQKLMQFQEGLKNQIFRNMSISENSLDFHQLRKDLKEYLFAVYLLTLVSQFVPNQEEIICFEHIQELIGRKHDLEKLQKRINKLDITSKQQKLTDKILKDEKKISYEISSLLKTSIKNFSNEKYYSKAV